MSDKVVTINRGKWYKTITPGEWYGRQELADKLGITVRTVSRKVEEGVFERKDTLSGKLYRPVLEGHAGTQRDSPKGQKRIQRDRTGHDPVSHIIEQNTALTKSLIESERARGVLEGRLEEITFHREDLLDQIEALQDLVDAQQRCLHQAMALVEMHRRRQLQAHAEG